MCFEIFQRPALTVFAGFIGCHARRHVDVFHFSRDFIGPDPVSPVLNIVGDDIVIGSVQRDAVFRANYEVSGDVMIPNDSYNGRRYKQECTDEELTEAYAVPEHCSGARVQARENHKAGEEH